TTAVVTVIDNTVPIAVAVDTTIYLDASGSASITAQQIGYGSDDNCGIDSLHINQAAFDCSEAGTVVPLVLTAYDPSGNTDTAHFNVTVLDTTPPVASGQDLTVHLDINGQASIVTGDIENGSSDNCSIANSTLQIETFDCSFVGDTLIWFAVEDPSGNSDTD